MGDCTFIIDNKSYDISKEAIPLYNSLLTENITYKWNDTFYLLKLEKQLDGVSNHGLLKGTKNGYECSGGLWECKDSCCLDGFCVEILFYCDSEDEDITFISMIIGIIFVILIVLYWGTYCFLGFKYKYDLTKTMDEERELFYIKKKKVKEVKDKKEINENSESEKNNIRINTKSIDVYENFVSQVPIMNNVIKNKKNALKN